MDYNCLSIDSCVKFILSEVWRSPPLDGTMLEHGIMTVIVVIHLAGTILGSASSWGRRHSVVASQKGISHPAWA